MKILLSLILLSLTNCAYKPIIDSKGRAGTWNESRAAEVTDDINHCTMLAEANTNKVVEVGKGFYNYLIRPQTLWLSPEAKYDRETYIRNCLKGRNHNVIN